MTPLLLLMAAASAQDIYLPPVPELNAQLYRPVMDSPVTMWTDTSGGVLDRSLVTARLAVHYVHRPFVFVSQSQGLQSVIVSDVLQADAIAAYAFDRFRVGVDMPLYLISAGEQTENGAGIGDLAVDGRATIVDVADGAVGFALGGRLTLPTSSVDAPLGAGGSTAELQAITDIAITDSTLLAVNLGTRLAPESDVHGLSLKDQLVARVGLGQRLSDVSGVSGDLATQVPYSIPLSDGSAVPLEALVGGWYRLAGDWVARGAVGRGITQGIGAPNARAVLMIAYEPALDDIDGDGYADSVDQCPMQAEDFDDFQDDDGCPEPDNDEDGIADTEDDCPMDAEDLDAFQDDDGCPDVPVSVQIRVVGPDGSVIDNASAAVLGRGIELPGGGEFQVELNDGSYTLLASAPGYADGEHEFSMTPDAAEVITLTLEPRVDLGSLVIELVDQDGVPIDAATWTLGGEPGPALVKGAATVQRPPDRYAIRIEAEGYVSMADTVAIAADAVTERVFVMRRRLVSVGSDSIEIAGTIYFELAKAIIKPESFDLLDEVAQTLQDHPELELVRIEGHTDSRGKRWFNQRLSDERAASVRAYLIEQGVAPKRLSSVGYGSSRPVDPREVEEAWERNRRVDFFIERRSDQ